MSINSQAGTTITPNLLRNIKPGTQISIRKSLPEGLPDGIRTRNIPQMAISGPKNIRKISTNPKYLRNIPSRRARNSITITNPIPSRSNRSRTFCRNPQNQSRSRNWVRMPWMSCRRDINTPPKNSKAGGSRFWKSRRSKSLYHRRRSSSPRSTSWKTPMSTPCKIWSSRRIRYNTATILNR